MTKIRLLLCLVLLACSYCRADIFVVVHKDNPVHELTPQEIRDLYLARSKAFPTGAFADVYDQKNTEVRQRFFQSLTGMNIRQIDAFWARLIFAGRVLPLDTTDNDRELISAIASDVNAIGYLAEKPDNPEIKTVSVIKE